MMITLLERTTQQVKDFTKGQNAPVLVTLRLVSRSILYYNLNIATLLIKQISNLSIIYQNFYHHSSFLKHLTPLLTIFNQLILTTKDTAVIIRTNISRGTFIYTFNKIIKVNLVHNQLFFNQSYLGVVQVAVWKLFHVQIVLNKTGSCLVQWHF